MELGGSFATPATDPTIIDATATVVRPEFGGTEEAAQRAVHNRLGLSRRGMNVVRAGLAVVALAVVADRFIPSSPATGAAEVSALAQGPGLVNGNTLNGGADCVTSGELYKNIAVTNTPSTEAIFQSLLTQPDKQGQQQLVSEAEAISKSREQVCGSTLALATITVIRELREKLQVPGQNILDLINQKVQSYDVNPTAATTDEELAYQFLGFMKANTQFPITTGNASRLVALNDQKTQIAGQAVTGTNNFSGMEFYFNTDDASLTPEQKAIYEKLSQEILYCEDGTIIFNNLALNYTINLDPNAPKVNVSPNTTNSSPANQSDNSGPNSGKRVGTTDTQNTTGGGASSTGAGTNEGQKNGTSLTGTGTGGGGGGTGTTGPGSTETTGPGSTTSTTGTVETTQPPQTTTTTQPTGSTTTTTTQVSPPTTRPKGTPPPCVPVPGFVVCP